MKDAIYPGSFDPFTKGHEDVLFQALGVFDYVVLLVCDNPQKKHYLSVIDRKLILDRYVKALGLTERVLVKVLTEGRAAVREAQAHGITRVIRGIRTVSDFEYEMQIAAMNNAMVGATTVYFTPSSKNQFTSSSMVRELYRLGECVDDLVPLIVREYLDEKAKEQREITG